MEPKNPSLPFRFAGPDGTPGRTMLPPLVTYDMTVHSPVTQYPDKLDDPIKSSQWRNRYFRRSDGFSDWGPQDFTTEHAAFLAAKEFVDTLDPCRHYIKWGDGKNTLPHDFHYILQLPYTRA